MKPLKAVEKTSEVDALYVKSIEERLKLLKWIYILLINKKWTIVNF